MFCFVFSKMKILLFIKNYKIHINSETREAEYAHAKTESVNTASFDSKIIIIYKEEEKDT